MKQYQILFDVPDNFVPEQLALQATYDDPEAANTITISDEGFVDGNQALELTDELKTFIENHTVILKDGSNEHDVVRIMFSSNSNVELDQLQTVTKVCEVVYQCPCICCTSDLDVLVENSDEAIKMLTGMIAKIKTRAAVKDTSGIILPN